MKFTAPILALLVNFAMSAAVPEAEPVGMVQKLSARSATGDMIFGRSFSCSSNDPTTCCSCRGGYGTCINGVCSCDGGDC